MAHHHAVILIPMTFLLFCSIHTSSSRHYLPLSIQLLSQFVQFRQHRCASNTRLRQQQTYSHTSSNKSHLNITISSAQENQARRDHFYRRQQAARDQSQQRPNMADDDPAAAPPVNADLAAILASANTNNAQLNATLQEWLPGPH